MKIKIHYVGKDLSYFDSLKAAYEKRYPDLEFEFSHIDQGIKDFNACQYFVQFYRSKYDILFIDFSLGESEAIEFCKLVREDSATKIISTTALHSYIDHKRTIPLALFAGIRINQIKCAEIGNVIYDSFVFYNQAQTITPDLACPRMKLDLELDLRWRVAYLTDTHIRVETNIPIEAEQGVKLFENPLKHIIKTNKFYLDSVDDRNLIYNMRFGLNFRIMYTPDMSENGELHENHGDRFDLFTPDEINYFNKNNLKFRKSYLKECQESVSNFIAQNLENFKPKTSKVLVLDQELEIYKHLDEPIENPDCEIFVQSEINDQLLIIKRKMPQIISFVYTKINPEKNKQITLGKKLAGMTAEKAKEEKLKQMKEAAQFISSGHMLSRLLNFVKKIDDYSPYIVLFNSKLSSDELQARLEYEKIISFPIHPQVKLLRGIAKVYNQKIELKKEKLLLQKIESLKEKDPAKYGKLKPEDLIERKVYFAPDDSNAFVTTKRSITVLGITEYEIFFSSKDHIPDYTVFDLDIKGPFLVTVVPHAKNSIWSKQDHCYRGLINGMGEVEKSELRQFINSIFTAELEKQREKEKEEFAKKNLEKKKQLEEAKRKAEQEEQERLEKEAQEDKKLEEEDKKKSA